MNASGLRVLRGGDFSVRRVILGVRPQIRGREIQMHRALPFLLFFASAVATYGEEPQGSSRIVETFDRTLRKEPEYQSTPKYCLLLLGAGGDVKVWMVEDGKRLYIDKNANGDLTDDGQPIEPSNTRKLGDGSWDFNYLFDGFSVDGGLGFSDFNLRRWNYGGKHDSYGLSLALEGTGRTLTKGKLLFQDTQLATNLKLSLSGQIPMYAGWFDTFWSPEPKEAPVIHFGGPLTPKMLREKEFVIGSGKRRLSLAFTNPGSHAGAVSLLSIDAVPSLITPKLVIKWPTASDSRSLETTHSLVDRCCYWEFYTTDFEVPDGLTTGTAQVSVKFADYELPIALTTSQIEVPVVESALKSEE